MEFLNREGTEALVKSFKNKLDTSLSSLTSSSYVAGVISEYDNYNFVKEVDGKKVAKMPEYVESINFATTGAGDGIKSIYLSSTGNSKGGRNYTFTFEKTSVGSSSSTSDVASISISEQSDSNPTKIVTDVQASGHDVTVYKKSIDGYLVTTDNISSLAPVTNVLVNETSVVEGTVAKINLSEYAKSTDLDGYAKSTDLDGYAKSTDLDGYAKSIDISSYIVDVQNSSGTSLVVEENGKRIAKIPETKIDLSSYAKTSDIKDGVLKFTYGDTSIAQFTANQSTDTPLKFSSSNNISLSVGTNELTISCDLEPLSSDTVTSICESILV